MEYEVDDQVTFTNPDYGTLYGQSGRISGIAPLRVDLGAFEVLVKRSTDIKPNSINAEDIAQIALNLAARLPDCALAVDGGKVCIDLPERPFFAAFGEHTGYVKGPYDWAPRRQAVLNGVEFRADTSYAYRDAAAKWLAERAERPEGTEAAPAESPAVTPKEAIEF